MTSPHAAEPFPSRRRRGVAGWLAAALALLGGVAFWGLRAGYWARTHEVPFSDMADFELIALRVLGGWDFRHSDFWLHYRPPVLPVMRAACMVLFGRDESLVAWHWFLATFTFGGLVWMARELVLATGRTWFGLAALWIVALAKPSIFWSYKLASEGPAEGFAYLSVAATLLALRRRTHATAFLAGGLYTATLLTRPLFALLAVLGPIGFWAAARSGGEPTRRRLTRTLALVLGVLVVWSPWLLRSVRLYGHVVPFTTQGPYSFLFEMGEFTVTMPDGTRLRTSTNQLQAEAPQRFDHDYEASRYGAVVVRQWLRGHWRTYLAMLPRRAVRSVADFTIYVTHVSRTTLFPGRLDAVLLDKTPLVFVAGIAGLVLLAVACPALVILPIVVLGSWGFGLLVLGYPRLLEPVLPLVLLGVPAPLVALPALLRRRAACRGRADTSRSRRESGARRPGG